jgi:hypothetical protein
MLTNAYDDKTSFKKAFNPYMSYKNKNTKTRINKFLDEVSSTCSGSNSFCSNNLTANIVKTWGYLFEKHNTNAINARKYWNTLSRFGYLNTTVQDYVIKFSDKPGEDESSKGTLQEFSDDLEPNNNNSNYENFNKFLNTYPLFAKGFVGYKTGVNVTKEQYDWMGEVLGQYYEETEPIRVKTEKWIDRSNKIAKTNKYLQDGKDFENWIKGELSTIKNTSTMQTAVYNALKAKISDLDERTIYTQVKFCINGNTSGNCTIAGSYFIADFVFVKEVNDPVNGNYLDVKIADTKLSQGTDFTDNQNDAQTMTSYYTSSIPNTSLTTNPVKGFNINNFNEKGVLVKRTSNFYKIFSGGTTTSLGGIN